MKTYRIRRTRLAYDLSRSREAFWAQAEVAEVAIFPWYLGGDRWRAIAQLLCDDQQLYFRMVSQDDRHIVGLHTEPNQPVYRDSCTEFFVAPRPDRGYFNLEINCVGAMLLAYGTGRLGRTFLAAEVARQVAIWHSIPGLIKREEESDCCWEIEAVIPYTVLRAHVDFETPGLGSEWRGNFYRCADGSSNPQWSCWNQIETDYPDFHRPEFFGRLLFA